MSIHNGSWISCLILPKSKLVVLLATFPKWRIVEATPELDDVYKSYLFRLLYTYILLILLEWGYWIFYEWYDYDRLKCLLNVYLLLLDSSGICFIAIVHTEISFICYKYILSRYNGLLLCPSMDGFSDCVLFQCRHKSI